MKAGIVGGTGYMGGEALRILLQHPGVEVSWITSRSESKLADHHPNLFGLDVPIVHPDDISAVDVAFLALPTEASIPMAAELLNQGSKVIDLGAAFRLSDRQQWEKVYSQRHSQWQLMDEAVYGISELHLDEIRRCNLVANPGCFSSAAILGLAPLVAENLIDTQHIVVDGISGTAGAGAELARPAHHAEIGNNLVPYNVVDHRHSYEMEQELSLLAGDSVRIHFTPVYAPITRGILCTCHTFPTGSLTRSAILGLYADYYQDSPFVKVFNLPREAGVSWQYKPYPWVSSVAGSNYCFIGADVDEHRNRVVVFSVLDSVGKGGALAGVENMNLMFGLERSAGLTGRSTHPA